MNSPRHYIFSNLLPTVSLIPGDSKGTMQSLPVDSWIKIWGHMSYLGDDPLLSDLEETGLLVLPRKLTSLFSLCFTYSS